MNRLWRVLYTLVYSASVGGLAAAYSAFILAEVGRFSGSLAGIIALGGALVAACFSWRSYLPLSRVQKMFWTFSAIIAAASFCITLPPSEMILGGWDPGVYVHTGAEVSRNASLQFDAGDIWVLPERMQDSVTAEIEGWRVPFPGIFPLSSGRFSPQFLHLYPSLLGFVYSIGGIWGALSVNSVLNAASLLAMYWIASSLLGDRWGAVATLFLMLNPAQIWQAKFGTAEMLTQILLLSGFALMISSSRQPVGIRKAVGSGLLFGFALLTRYDSILVIVPLVLVSAFISWESGRRKRALGLLAGLIPLALHLMIHLRWVAPNYRVLPHVVLPVVTTAVFMTGFFYLCGVSKMGLFLGRTIQNRQFLIRSLSTLLFFVFLFWACYIRPRLTVEGRVSATMGEVFLLLGLDDWNTWFAGPDAWNFRYLMSIFGVTGFFVSCMGILVFIWKKEEPAVLIWFVACLVPFVVLTTCIFHDHFMMWASRRFVPVVVPFFCITATAAVQAIYERANIRCPRFAVPLSSGLILAVILGVMPGSITMAKTREWPGLVRWYENLHKILPADALVLCDQPGFAAPLRFLHGIHAHEVYGDQTALEVVVENREFLQHVTQPVILLTMKPQDISHENRILLTEIENVSLRSHILQSSRYRVPTQTKGRGGDFILWQVGFVEPGTAEREL